MDLEDETTEVTFAFTSGDRITLDTMAKSIKDFFELNQNNDGRMSEWLLSSEGYAVHLSNVDWIRVDKKEVDA